MSLKPSDANLGDECPLNLACYAIYSGSAPVALSQEPAQGPTKESVFPSLAGGQGSLVQLGCSLALHHLWSGLCSGPPGWHSCPAGRG